MIPRAYRAKPPASITSMQWVANPIWFYRQPLVTVVVVRHHELWLAFVVQMRAACSLQ